MHHLQQKSMFVIAENRTRKLWRGKQTNQSIDHFYTDMYKIVRSKMLTLITAVNKSLKMQKKNFQLLRTLMLHSLLAFPHCTMESKAKREVNRETKDGKSIYAISSFQLPTSTQSLLKRKKNHSNSVIVSHTHSLCLTQPSMSFHRLLLEVVATTSALHLNGGQIRSETTVARWRILALRDLVHAGRRLELQHCVFRAIFGVVNAQL